jgi:exosome complex RNA-binding protein Csl4
MGHPVKSSRRAFRTVGGYVFSLHDVMRVNRGVDKARCRRCTGSLRYAQKARPDCQDCKKTQDRLRVLEAEMKTEELL